jgi:hypothetical protein
VTQQLSPELEAALRAAIFKGVFIDAAILFGGVALFFVYESVIPIFVAMVLSMGVMVFLLSQAGAFDRHD